MNIIRCSLVFISLLLHIFGEPTPIGFNGNSAAGSLGGGSLSAPSSSAGVAGALRLDTGCLRVSSRR